VHELIEVRTDIVDGVWTALASNPGTRPSLDQTCEFVLTSIKASFSSLSCEW